jgi:hypothetical protein
MNSMIAALFAVSPKPAPTAANQISGLGIPRELL